MNVELSVSEFVTILNQTLEFAYPFVTIVGELANFRVGKNRWLYFDLKDDEAVVRCFGTVYSLPGPLEDGMLLRVSGSPRLHQLYGFSFNVQKIMPSGEGSIKKAANLLEAKLAAEGLFDESRKRLLPYPPLHVGLVTSSEAAAYTDFLKVLNGRWGGMEVDVADVQVQGEAAAEQIVRAIQQFNALSQPPEVLVITRGGGSADDLQAFSTEQVTRVVAASRIPTLVAIGHERDVSLAELAADVRASTPSNAAELLVPARTHVLSELNITRTNLQRDVAELFLQTRASLEQNQSELLDRLSRILQAADTTLRTNKQLLSLLDPRAPLTRGYVLVSNEKGVIRSVRQLQKGKSIIAQFQDGLASADVTSITFKK